MQFASGYRLLFSYLGKNNAHKISVCLSKVGENGKATKNLSLIFLREDERDKCKRVSDNCRIFRNYKCQYLQNK